jgi:hypothetical protein
VSGLARVNLIDALPPERSFSALQGASTPRLSTSNQAQAKANQASPAINLSLYLVPILLSNSNIIDSSISHSLLQSL